MSLFKARNFWTFELSELDDNLGANGEAKEDEDEDDQFGDQPDEVEGQAYQDWSVGVSRFEATGDHEVFVCGRLGLRGLICILQVPEGDQIPVERKMVATTNNEPNKLSAGFGQRQLLFASSLAELDCGGPIICVKCGHFASAVRQSIALLSINQLTIYQVSKTTSLIQNSTKQQFDIKLEQLHRFELLAGEIPVHLLVLRPQLEVNQAQPQRSPVLVQYANQHSISLIDNRKLVGHFQLEFRAAKGKTNEESGSQFAGASPAGFLHVPSQTGIKNASLRLLFLTGSDHLLRCLHLDKLFQVANQRLVQRAANNLLEQQQQQQKLVSFDDSIESSSNLHMTDRISVNLICGSSNSLAEWTIEMAFAPISLETSISSKHDNAITTTDSKQTSFANLLVLTRHTLELLDATSGRHLWSHRFEAAPLCFRSYLGPQRQLMMMVVTESVGGTAGHSSSQLLLIDRKDIVRWSANLPGLPQVIWRLDLARMGSVVACVDFQSGQLSTCYLGTDEPKLTGLTEDKPMKEDDGNEVSRCWNLLQVEEENNNNTGSDDDQQNKCDNKQELPSQRLNVNVRLDARDHGPEMKVDAQISLSLNNRKSAKGSALRNISAFIEFDDLLVFQPKAGLTLPSRMAPGFVHFRLGSCWPDRREPIKMEGSFGLRRNRIGRSLLEAGIGDSSNPLPLENLLPGSLRVNIHLSFSEWPVNEGGHRWEETHFLLPFGLFGQLQLIDYICLDTSQSLLDVHTNLAGYKRPHLESKQSPYFSADLLLAMGEVGELIEFVDDLVESDLLCRGSNLEGRIENATTQVRRKSPWAALETINLLGQSLDCGLRFERHQKAPVEGMKRTTGSELNQQAASNEKKKEEEGVTSAWVGAKLSRPAGSSADDPGSLVMLSVALKMASCRQLMGGLSQLSELASEWQDETVVWVHFCDLSKRGVSAIPNQLLNERLAEWKALEIPSEGERDSTTPTQTRPSSSAGNEAVPSQVLITIESEFPVPVLHLLAHLKGRLEQLKPELAMKHLDSTGRERLWAAASCAIGAEMGRENYLCVGQNLHLALKCFILRGPPVFGAMFANLGCKSAASLKLWKVDFRSAGSLRPRRAVKQCETDEEAPNDEDEDDQVSLGGVGELDDVDRKLKKFFACIQEIVGLSKRLVADQQSESQQQVQPEQVEQTNKQLAELIKAARWSQHKLAASLEWRRQLRRLHFGLSKVPHSFGVGVGCATNHLLPLELEELESGQQSPNKVGRQVIHWPARFADQLID